MDEKQEMTPQQHEMALYEGAVQRFGSMAQIDQAIEEMAELTVALNKYKRFIRSHQGNKEAVLRHVAEERADVSIMLCQLGVIFGDNSDMECEKLEHLEDLLSADNLLGCTEDADV
jgi:hypothetical protein